MPVNFKNIFTLSIVVLLWGNIYSQEEKLNSTIKWVKVYTEDPYISTSTEIALGAIRDVVVKNKNKDGYQIIKIKDKKTLLEFQNTLKKSVSSSDTLRITPKIVLEIKLKNYKKQSIYLDYFSNLSNEGNLSYIKNEALLNLLWTMFPVSWKTPFSER